MAFTPWKNKLSETFSRNDGNPLNQLRAQLDNVFDTFLKEPWTNWSESAEVRGIVPVVDVTEDEHEITIRVEIAGVKPEDVEVTLHSNLLTISGEKKDACVNKSGECHQTESRYGRFHRSVQLPVTADLDKVSATHDNGVLTIHVLKSTTAQPRKIAIQSATSSAPTEPPAPA